NPVVKPDTSTTYTITVTDKNGCEATDQLRVNIISTDVAFIPNVFSPNGDGINDKLNFFCSDKVMNIKHFAIFDRWGESVYDAIDIPVNDLDYGWDGKQKGQKANSAVYVYYIELTLIDGTVKILKGDINLIR
ncbi:MAG TPA: gliding motility-associated C-terminal domain-containing protein, partial [Saprospiraceae bacterium]|nr:gliding motility-associated C-terminal domain-containing protein [Saprospiraceae bacterium]